MGKGNLRQSRKVTWAQAFRDTVIAAMNKGQLPFYCLFIVVLFILWRLPSEDLADISRSTIQKLDDGELWSYILVVLISAGWFLHARHIRRVYSQEFNRVAEEKSGLQRKAANKKFKSSQR